MMPSWNSLPSWSLGLLPGLAAFALVLAGTVLSRRAEGRLPGIVALGILAGWMVAVPTPPAWWAPRAVAEHLVVPALAGLGACVAAARLGGRVRGWAMALALGVAAWWLAGAPPARGEFWRVWFGVAAVAWVLRLSGGRTGLGAVLVGGVLVAGAAVGGLSALWVGVVGVLLGAGLGVAVLRPGTVLSGIGPAAGLVGLEIGAGGLLRGRFGFVEVLCGAALAAPWVQKRAEPLIGRRLGRFGRAGSAAATVVALVGVAMLAGRVLGR